MQFERHSKARELFKTIDKNPSQYLIIHYSCESFYEISEGHTPRITSIAVYNYATAQTDSFTILKTAEKKHIAFENIESRYDDIEKQMLVDFFSYAKEHRDYFWIHWNMRNMSFGFKALEHRCSVLGGKPFIIPDEKKIDLSRLLIDCYGVQYIDHPRMEKLMEHNSIGAKDYLNGQAEVEAFKNKEYAKLHVSTLKKVDVFSNLLTRAINRTLKVKSKWYQIYGVSIQGIYNYYVETWWLQLIGYVVTLVLGGLIGKLFA